MPIFTYRAKKENAQTVFGEIPARDQEEAVELITAQGLIPVVVHERVPGGASRVRRLSRRVSPRDLYVLTRQIVGLLRSGMPVDQALDLLSRQTPHPGLSSVLKTIVADLHDGKPLSLALGAHPRVFSDVYVAMARAGEESGQLRELLSSVAEHYKRQADLEMRVRTALTYPVFMLVVGIATVFFILTFVMPRITVLFQGMGTTLPWPTVVIITLSHFMGRAWPFVFLGVLGFAILLRSSEQVRLIRRWGEGVLSRVPFVRDLLLKVDLQRFSRTLGLLLQAGVPILKAFETAIPTLMGTGIQRGMWQVHALVQSGEGFGEALRSSGVVPEVFARLVSVGEGTGEVAGTLGDIAESYEQEIDETIKSLTSLLEPLMILGIGLVVGFIVFAMLLPVFQMDIFAS